MTIRWLTKQEIIAIRGIQLAWHGGASGVRDEGLLESSLMRAQNIARYADEAPSPVILAAALGSGIIKAMPFIDGNKRVGLVAAFTFLKINGFNITVSQESACVAFDYLAAGKLSEDEFARWLEANTEPVSK